MVRTGIGRNNVLCLGGEVDCVWDEKPEKQGDPIQWVELKTSAEIESARDAANFERKLMKFWIQSFLLGVPRIIVGFRDRNGTLVRIEQLETIKIPDRVRVGEFRSWDGNTCINFASAFLDCKSAAWASSPRNGCFIWTTWMVILGALTRPQGYGRPSTMKGFGVSSDGPAHPPSRCLRWRRLDMGGFSRMTSSTGVSS